MVTDALLAILLRLSSQEDPAELYRRGEFARAEAAWTAQLSEPAFDPLALRVNLGLAIQKQGRWAEAMLRFRQALLYAPDDPRGLARVQALEQKLGIAPESPPSGWSRAWARLRRGGFEWAPWVGVLMLLLARSHRGRRRFAGVVLVLATLFALLPVFVPESEPPRLCVVTQEGAGAYAEPHPAAPRRRSWIPGTTLRVAEASDRWVRVEMGAESLWVPSEAIAFVERNQ